MKHLLVGLMMCSLGVNAQVFLKSGIGYSDKSLLTEVDAGYKLKVHQMSIGYVYIPYLYKSVYNVKYGYWLNNFNLHGGLGLVNKSDKENNVQAYSTFVLGAEYNTKEVLQNTRLYFGADLVDKSLTVKAGVKIFYDKIVR